MTQTRSPEKPKKRVRLPALHPGQREVYESPARFKVVACGRQWGKSRLGSVWVLERMLKGKGGWWVAPDANVAYIGWELLKGLAQQIRGHEIHESRRIIKLPSGGWVQVKGAHNEGKLRGVTLDYLVMDEAAFVPSSQRWSSELRPTLAVKGGEALFTSTFDGENWFYDLYQLGQSDNDEWESWRKPSTENPYFPLSELELARKTTPRAEFEQEYMANPLVYVGAVFNGEQLQVAVDRGHQVKRDPAMATYAGLDWGYSNETALEVCQEHPSSGAISWFYEKTWTATELNERCEAIARKSREFGVRVIFADAAGATENRTLVSHLQRTGAQTVVKPVSFSKYKDVGIQTRRWYLENDLEALGVPKLSADSKRYRYKEGKEEVEKVDDHTVDAATAFYSSRRHALMNSGRR